MSSNPGDTGQTVGFSFECVSIYIYIYIYIYIHSSMDLFHTLTAMCYTHGHHRKDNPKLNLRSLQQEQEHILNTRYLPKKRDAVTIKRGNYHHCIIITPLRNGHNYWQAILSMILPQYGPQYPIRRANISTNCSSHSYMQHTKHMFRNCSGLQ